MTLLCAEVEFLNLRPGAKQSSQSPRDLRVLQTEYGHEVAVIAYDYDETLKNQCVRGLPVRASYGFTPTRSTYVGAVHHVAVDQAPSAGGSVRRMQVVCVGPTDVLNIPGAAQYRETRVDAVVIDLATTAGLSCLIERHEYSWPLLQQLNQSSWAFLVACARRAGRTLYASGTDIRCHGRAIRFSGAPVFRDFAGASSERLQGAIYAFGIVHAETLNAEAKKRERVLQGVDEQGMLFTTATGQQAALSGPRGVTAKLADYRKLSARSVAEADALLAGEQELSRHYIKATATISGDAGVHAGRSVRLTDIGRDYSGYWYVEKAEHRVSETLYQIGVSLGRDSLGEHARLPILTTERRRVVVNDGRLLAPNPASFRQTAPDGYWSTVTNSWRSKAPTVRYLDPPLRSPVVPAAVSRV